MSRSLDPCIHDQSPVPARGLLRSVTTAAAIAFGAWRFRALSSGGAVAATVVGTAVYAGAGLRSAVALVVYFVSSTLFGCLPGVRLEQRRGRRRDAIQVLANGGVAALLAAASTRRRAASGALLATGVGGAIAAAAADTWATELGSRATQAPRSIVTGRRVSPGTSGGVTAVGLAASLSASIVIAGVASAAVVPRRAARKVSPAAIALGGLCGSLVDSLIGATVQEVRYCPTCDRESELITHGCGAVTRHLRGASWCTNDTVNVVATAMGAATAILVAWWRSQDRHDETASLSDRSPSVHDSVGACERREGRVSLPRGNSPASGERCDRRFDARQLPMFR
jgi:uncharacterized protein (TIGR00297 family)